MNSNPVIISLSPNVEGDDVRLALKTLLSPGKWFDRNEVEQLEQEFAELFGDGYQAIAINSGRSAQYLILRALGLSKTDQVLLQAFTCIAVPNAVLWVGAQPVFADIDESYNLDPQSVRKSITPETKALIAQHTFGISSPGAPVPSVFAHAIDICALPRRACCLNGFRVPGLPRC